MKFSFQIITFGCKVNQYESQAIREHWTQLGGYEIRYSERFTKKYHDKHIILIDGCAVTASGVSDARQMVRKIKRELPHAKVIVSGCAASAEPKDFQFPHVIACIEQSAKWNLLHHDPFDLPDNFTKNEQTYPEFQIKTFERSRPILKVQDGCSHGCTYCIVPLTRGKARTRAPKESYKELDRLFEAGFREIMISGINLRQYQHNKENFWGFLRQIQKEFGEKWQGRARLRLSSLEPAQINNEALETLEACKLLCPHLHLSLQSGSPTVLKRMNREHYSLEIITEKIQKIHQYWPKFALGADILMGFVGETEVEVKETLTMVDKLPLTYAHVFPYSIRKGTKAATMQGHLDKIIRQDHAARVRERINIKKQAFLASMLELDSLWVSLDIQENTGWNEFYVSCHLENAPNSHELQRVKPLEIKDEKLITTLM